MIAIWKELVPTARKRASISFILSLSTIKFEIASSLAIQFEMYHYRRLFLSLNSPIFMNILWRSLAKQIRKLSLLLVILEVCCPLFYNNDHFEWLIRISGKIWPIFYVFLFVGIARQLRQAVNVFLRRAESNPWQISKSSGFLGKFW